MARVLRWGSGYTGCEDPMSLLRDVIDAEEIRLDRWTVVFHPEDKQDEPKELSKQLPGKPFFLYTVRSRNKSKALMDGKWLP